MKNQHALKGFVDVAEKEQNTLSWIRIELSFDWVFIWVRLVFCFLLNLWNCQNDPSMQLYQSW